MSAVTINEPKAWIGCLSCYNAGYLVGDWYPAADAAGVTPSQLHARDLPPDTHEELWCFDTEGIPVRGEISPMTATAWAELLEKVPSDDRPAFDAWLDNQGVSDPDDDLVEQFEDAYLGRWDSFEDYCEDLLTSTGMFDGVPSMLRDYFDFADYARDQEPDHTVIAAPGLSVFVFRD